MVILKQVKYSSRHENNLKNWDSKIRTTLSKKKLISSFLLHLILCGAKWLPDFYFIGGLNVNLATKGVTERLTQLALLIT